MGIGSNQFKIGKAKVTSKNVRYKVKKFPVMYSKAVLLKSKKKKRRGLRNIIINYWCSNVN